MKRARVSFTSDDQLPDQEKQSAGLQQQIQGHPFSPLDVTNFPVNWPIWRQKFQIYVTATQNHLPDRKKLAIFLNCLGDEGIAVATSFFPQIIDVDCAEAMNITLDMVWSRFNDHCASMKDVKLQENTFLASHEFFKTLVNNDKGIIDCYLKLLSAANKCDFTCRVCQTSYTERIVRDQLVRVISDKDKVVELLDLWNPSCQEIIATHEEIRVDQKLWPEILPYLSLCDIDTAAQMSPRLKRIVHQHVHSGSHGLQIDPCCLQKHPIDTDKKFYDKYKRHHQLLKLRSISKTEADQVLQCFPKLAELALDDIQIYEDLRWFPPSLQSLTITNSVIERHLLQGWLDKSRETLQFLKIENVDHSFPLHGKVAGLWKPIDLEQLCELCYLIIRCDSLSIKFRYKYSLEFIHIRARELNDCSFHCTADRLIFEAATSSLSSMLYNYNNVTVKDLTLPDWTSPSDLTAFNSIENSIESLTILSPIDVKYKEQIENLPIKRIRVTYEQSPEEEEPELIFQMLNDDCFLEIISYLKKSDWINFGLVHPRSFWIVLNYKYRRANNHDSDFEDASITPEQLQVIQPFVRRMTIGNRGNMEFLGQFQELTSLTFDRFQLYNHEIKQLPDDLEKLCLWYCSRENYDNVFLSEYFKRLRPTLRVFGMAVGDEGEYLIDLGDLREIELKLSNTRKVGVDPSFNVATCLKQNPGLQRVDLYLEDGCMGEGVWNALGALKNISDLSISRRIMTIFDDNMGFVRNMIGLLEKIGPQLKTLALYILNDRSSCMLGSPNHLNNLRELKVVVGSGLQETVENISRLKSLRTLRMDKCTWFGSSDKTKTSLTGSDVMLLVKELPNLRQIHSNLLEPFTIKMGLEFQQYLRESNRELRINSVAL